MFQLASSFNGDISTWNVSKGEKFVSAFTLTWWCILDLPAVFLDTAHESRGVHPLPWPCHTLTLLFCWISSFA